MTPNWDVTAAGTSLRPDRQVAPTARSEAVPLAVLLLCAVLPYANSLLNDFIITYDDGAQVLKNPYVHSFRYLREIFTTNVWSYLGPHTVTNYYRPVMSLGYLLCYKIFGPDAYGFHLFSIVLHAAVVVLVFVVTRQMTADRVRAFVAGALFAFHPIHTEAVDWISAVTELESTLFFLATFALFLRAGLPSARHSGKGKLAMVGCYSLALLSKEQAMVLPALATVYEHFYRADRGQTNWRQKAPRYLALWLLSLAYMVVRSQLLGGFAPLLQRAGLSAYQTVVAATALLAQYAWKLIWPVHLCFYYPFPEDLSPLVPWAAGGTVILLVSAVSIVALRGRNGLASFSVVWLLVTLVPVLNARWLATNVFTERYLYLPSVGFCWLAGLGWVRCWEIASERRGTWRRVLILATSVILALCIIRIATRNRDWRNDVVLYTRTLETTPSSYRVVSALGLAYWMQGNVEAAQQQWRQAVSLAPNEARVWNYLGTALARKRHFAEAVRSFQHAIELEPGSPEAHLNLGVAYAEQGLMKQAESHLRAAVALSPLQVQARNVLGKLYYDTERRREAEEQFLRSIAIEPNVPAYSHLGHIYLWRGDRERAEKAFKAALALNPRESHVHLSLGSLYAATGRFAEAIAEYRAGLLGNPSDRVAQEALRRLEQQVGESKSLEPGQR